MSEPGPAGAGREDERPEAEGTAALDDLDRVDRRLSPRSIALEFITVVRQSLFPLLLLLFFSTRSEDPWFLWGLAVYAPVPLIAAAVRYFWMRYGVVDGQLVIRSGVLERQVRRIPVEKIQNIALRAGPLSRVLGVVEVDVETAGSIETEAKLRFIERADAERFRRELYALRARGGDDDIPAIDAPGAVGVWYASLPELALAGATENRVGALVAGIAALTQFVDEESPWAEPDTYVALLQQWLDTEVGVAAQMVVVAMLLVAIVMLGWLVSIVLTVVAFHGFTLTRQGDELHRRHGLLTRVEGVLPLRRLQVLRVEQTLLRRWFGLAVVKAASAGVILEGDRAAAASTMLCPLLRRRQAASFCRAVFADLDLDRVELRSVHPLARRRGFLRLLLVATPLVAAVALGVDARAWAALLLVVPAAWWVACIRYRTLGYRVVGRFLVARAGVLRCRTWIVPLEKMQSIALRRSPFQRPLGLATVVVETAGGTSWDRTTVVDLGLDDALALLDELTRGAVDRVRRLAAGGNGQGGWGGGGGDDGGGGGGGGVGRVGGGGGRDDGGRDEGDRGFARGDADGPPGSSSGAVPGLSPAAPRPA